MDWFYSRVHRTERVKAGRMEEEKREETRKKERKRRGKQRGKQRGTEEAWGNNKIAGVLPSAICNTIDQPLLGFDFFDSASFASILFFFFSDQVTSGSSSAIHRPLSLRLVQHRWTVIPPRK